jgi:hypothetical protein
MLHSGRKRSHNLAVGGDGSYLVAPEQPVGQLYLTKRKDLVRYFGQLGFEGSYSGGKHQFMIKSDITIFTPVCSDVEWQKTDCAFGNVRFFVGRLLYTKQ